MKDISIKPREATLKSETTIICCNFANIRLTKCNSLWPNKTTFTKLARNSNLYNIKETQKNQLEILKL